MISFKTTKSEQKIIAAIADRAAAIAQREADFEYSRVDAEMDVTATHANGCRLRLNDLLAAEPFDFAHDVFGIRRHLNRTTGQVEGHFSPRYAEHE